MSILTVTASPSLSPRSAAKPLAPTLGNAIARMGTPTYDDTVRPSVSVATYASFLDLCRSIRAIDERFDRQLSVAIELSDDDASRWRQLSRVANPGGRLAIVIPQSSPACGSMSRPDALKAEIAGWDDVQASASIDEAMRRLLRRDVKRCFVLRPEGGDPAPILQAIGRYLAA